MQIFVVQQFENLFDSFIHYIWKSIKQVCKSDNDVGFYPKLNFTLH